MCLGLMFRINHFEILWIEASILVSGSSWALFSKCWCIRSYDWKPVEEHVHKRLTCVWMKKVFIHNDCGLIYWSSIFPS